MFWDRHFRIRHYPTTVNNAPLYPLEDEPLPFFNATLGQPSTRFVRSSSSLADVTLMYMSILVVFVAIISALVAWYHCVTCNTHRGDYCFPRPSPLPFASSCAKCCGINSRCSIQKCRFRRRFRWLRQSLPSFVSPMASIPSLLV